MTLYHEGSRRLQDRFDTRRLADRLEDVKVRDTIGPEDRAFIESMDMLFLATADEHGRPTCSYKGGDPGFVRVLDERTIAFPSYDGNGMFLSAGNVLVNPEVGLLFVSFERRRRLRLNGTASIATTVVANRMRTFIPLPSRRVHRAVSRLVRPPTPLLAGRIKRRTIPSAPEGGAARPERRRTWKG